MAYETILYTVEDGIATLTLNRPEVLNAFNQAMTDEIQDALKKAERDEAARCLVITGMGRAFSAGEDLKSHAGEGERDFAASLRNRYNPIIRKLRALNKPVLGAVNGVAAGAGFSLALACDLRIASDKARFLQAFVRIGLVPDSGSSWFLPQLIGYAKAAELCMLGEEVNAQQALELGLVNKVVAHDELAATTAEWATRLAQGPTLALGLMKRALIMGTQNTLDEVLDYEVYGQTIAGRSEDGKEGAAAFIEKRKANFKGK
ncbi:MAG: 2-(1,2-epoxy-1,2-dihydrophenyl)acetyl-CoA isomerase [Candidatus Chloroheliales bacterium]|nr:MAG: 2-(1,2-epoxy-1,2-dihydrophenyl)acetyl-CoA isomerase [Chloroflexota bacterium]